MWFELSWLECFEVPLGAEYIVLKTKRGGSRQDGCAMLIRRQHTVVESAALHYADVTQRVAQVVTIQTADGGEVVIGNTHLGRGETEIDRELRAAQASELGHALLRQAEARGGAAVIAAGGWGDAVHAAGAMEGTGISCTELPAGVATTRGKPGADMVLYGCVMPADPRVGSDYLGDWLATVLNIAYICCAARESC
jgi:hypothetical protein